VLVDERHVVAEAAEVGAGEKTRSCEEVRTTARTSPSSRARLSAPVRSSRSSLESELRVSGSSSVIVATPSSTS